MYQIFEASMLALLFFTLCPLRYKSIEASFNRVREIPPNETASIVLSKEVSCCETLKSASAANFESLLIIIVVRMLINRSFYKNTLYRSRCFTGFL